MIIFRLAALILAITLFAPLSLAWAQGTVYGTITGNGAPVKDITVMLCKLAGAGCYSCQYATTNKAGAYSFSSVADGYYFVLAYFPESSGYFVSTYYNGKTKPCEATAFTVVSTSNLQRNIALDSGGKISGTVTVNGEVPKESLLVSCIDYSAGNSAIGIASTTDGKYTTTTAVPGSYICYMTYASKTTYYNNKTTMQDADIITVNYHTTTPNINFNLTGSSAGMPVAVVPICGQ